MFAQFDNDGSKRKIFKRRMEGANMNAKADTVEEREAGAEAQVEVLNTKTNKEAKFKVPWSTTLQAVWDKSYSEFKPPEQKDPKDGFQCQKGGTSLTPYLGLTLKQAREQHVCVDRKYQIVGGTGGAA